MDKNLEKKYIKYKKKYIDLKNKKLNGGVGPLDFIHPGSSSKRIIRMPKVCYVQTKRLMLGEPIYDYCTFLPAKCVNLFEEICQRSEISNPPFTSSPTQDEIVHAYNEWRKFINGIVIMTIILMLLTENIYVFNHAIIPFLRDRINNKKKIFNKCYRKFKQLKLVCEKEYITKGTFIDSKVNALSKVLEEHRLYTIGLKESQWISRLPNPHPDDIKDALANLIFDFKLPYDVIVNYCNDERLRPYIEADNFMYMVDSIWKIAFSLECEINTISGIKTYDEWRADLIEEKKRLKKTLENN
jgi:hypothetical protein